MGRWREKTWPVEVRIYSEPFDRARWALWSRHRGRNDACSKALKEASKKHPTRR